MHSKAVATPAVSNLSLSLTVFAISHVTFFVYSSQSQAAKFTAACSSLAFIGFIANLPLLPLVLPLSVIRPSLSIDPIIYTPLSQVLLSIQITAKLPSVDKHGVFKHALAELQKESRGCIEAARIQEGWSITGRWTEEGWSITGGVVRA